MTDSPSYVRVFATGSLGVFAVAKSLLEAERIEHFTKNEHNYGSYATYNVALGPMEIWVRPADAEDARTIFKDLTEDGRPASD